MYGIGESWRMIGNPEHMGTGTLNKAHSKIVQELIYGMTVSKDQKLWLVSRDGLSIKHIKNPDEDIQLGAVRQNPYAIEYIINPSNRVRMVAAGIMFIMRMRPSHLGK